MRAPPTTIDVLVTVEGHYDGARADIEAATAELATLLRTYASLKSIESGLVDATEPAAVFVPPS